MKYLAGTESTGVTYPPEQEAAFEKQLSELASHHENEGVVDKSQSAAPLTVYTDASPGVAHQSFKSISGIVIYLFGTPIAWRSKRQTLAAASTTESEWVALADGLVMEQGPRALVDFMYGSSQKVGPVVCDNRGAVVSGRKGVEDAGEIPPKTRHVALRHAKVLENHDRLWFCPTEKQKADGLTKSPSRQALSNIFGDKSFPYIPKEGFDGGYDEQVNFVEAYIAICPEGP